GAARPADARARQAAQPDAELAPVDARLKAALASALGSEIATARGLAGGDINVAHELALVDGRRLFVKTNDHSPRGMFAAEARGLSWLAEAGALRLPEVVAVAAPD